MALEPDALASYSGPPLNLGLHLQESGGRNDEQQMNDVQILALLDEYRSTLCDRMGYIAGSAIGPGSAKAHRLAPGWFGIWQNWGFPKHFGEGGGGGRFPTSTMMHGLRDRGILPMITWIPKGGEVLSPRTNGWYYINQALPLPDRDKSGNAMMPNVRIDEGFANDYLDEWVDDYWEWLKELPAYDATWGSTRSWSKGGTLSLKRRRKQASVIIRLMHEPNIAKYSWSNLWPKADSAFTDTKNNDANYKAAFVHVAQRVKQRLADKKAAEPGVSTARIYFTYCPSGIDFDHFPATPNVVDYMGFDFYNRTQCENAAGDNIDCKQGVKRIRDGRSIRDRVQAIWEAMEAGIPLAYRGMPYIIGEFGITNPTGYCPASGDADISERTEWMKGIAGVLALPGRPIRSMGYYHVDMTADVNGRPIEGEGRCANWLFGTDSTRGTNSVWKTWALAADKYQVQFGID